jgi:hypothetical protein
VGEPKTEFARVLPNRLCVARGSTEHQREGYAGLVKVDSAHDPKTRISGHSWTVELDGKGVVVPFSSACWEYSISQIEGLTSGGFVETNVTAGIGSERGLPLTFPYRQPGEWSGRADVYFDVPM